MVGVNDVEKTSQLSFPERRKKVIELAGAFTFQEPFFEMALFTKQDFPDSYRI